MVEQSDRAPLLDWEEIPTSDPNQVAPSPPAPPREEDAPAEKSSQTAGRQPPTSAAAGTGWSSSTTTSTSTTTTSPAATTITCSPTRSVTAVVGSGDRSLGRPKSELTGHRWTRPEPLGKDRNVPFTGLSVRDQWEEKDQIVAVFVVTFDTRSGKREIDVREPYFVK